MELSESAAAALGLFQADQPPIPLRAGTCHPSVDPAEWYSAISEDTIRCHWDEHPDDDVGQYIEADTLAVTARTGEGQDALLAIAEKHGITPVLTTFGPGGVSYYFKQATELAGRTYTSTEHLHVIPCDTLISQGKKVHCVVDSTADPSAVVTNEFMEDLTALMAQQPPPPTKDQLVSESWAAVSTPEQPTKKLATNIDCSHPLASLSLTGQSEELAKHVQAQTFLIGKTALLGQSTAYYAAPNTGKTLLVMKELVSSIKAGRVAAQNVYYFNMDDNAEGLLTKLRIAEQHGFHMVADGHMGFSSADFVATILKLLETERCQGIVLILDTVKKVTDIMDKRTVVNFTRVMRRFVMKGGTVIALAHTNKHPRPDGTPVYAGTTDLRDDFDCAYTMQELQVGTDPKIKYVEMRNIKRRGDVAEQAIYTYTPSGDYLDLVRSTRPVPEEQMRHVKHEASLAQDADLIDLICQTIDSASEKRMARMELVAKVRQAAQLSRAEVLRVLDLYSGSTPMLHIWDFEVKERGAKVYRVWSR